MITYIEVNGNVYSILRTFHGYAAKDPKGSTLGHFRTLDEAKQKIIDDAEYWQKQIDRAKQRIEKSE